MSKKKIDLVDSLVFRKGKEVIDRITNNSHLSICSPNNSSNISPDTTSVVSPNTTPINSSNISPNLLFQNESVILNENQYILYYCLKKIEGAITTLSLIKKETNISENTLKGNLKKLRTLNIIDYKGRQHAGGNKFGFIAIVRNCSIVLIGDKEKVFKKIKRINWNNLSLLKDITSIKI